MANPGYSTHPFLKEVGVDHIQVHGEATEDSVFRNVHYWGGTSGAVSHRLKAPDEKGGTIRCVF